MYSNLLSEMRFHASMVNLIGWYGMPSAAMSFEWWAAILCLWLNR